MQKRVSQGFFPRFSACEPQLVWNGYRDLGSQYLPPVLVASYISGKELVVFNSYKNNVKLYSVGGEIKEWRGIDPLIHTCICITQPRLIIIPDYSHMAGRLDFNRRQWYAAFVYQAVGKASSLHIILQGAILAGEEAACQRVVKHPCLLDSILCETQMPHSDCGGLIVKLPPFHAVGGPGSIDRRGLTILDFEIAALVRVFSRLLASATWCTGQ